MSICALKHRQTCDNST